MAVILRSTASMVCLGLLVLALRLVPDEGDDPVVDPIEITEIMTNLDEGKVDQEAEEAAGLYGLSAVGDTCMMRHRRVLASVPRDVRQRFAAARIAEASVGPDIQTPLQDRLTGLTLWRLHMQRADVAFRGGDTEQARQSLAQALTVPDVPLTCASDIHLLSARLATASGDITGASAALVRATEADPGHFNAHFERAVLAVRRVAEGGRSCVTAIPEMVTSAVYLQRLIETSSQLWRLREQVAQLDVPPDTKAFLFGFVEERSGAPRRAAATYVAALARVDASAGECNAALAAALRLSLERVSRAEDGEKGTEGD